MDQAKLEQFRNRLQAVRHRYEDMVQHLNDWGLEESMAEAYDEISMYDNHPADAGTEMFEREKDVGLRAHAIRQLAHIDDALARVENGSYGGCSECGRPIAEARLEAFPFTTLCIDCATRREHRPNVNPRPVEEQVLNPPFGRSFRDGGNTNYWDGEDAWQEVGSYGTSEGPQDVPGATTYNDMYKSDEENGLVEEIEGLVDETGEPLQTDDRGR